MTIIFIIVITTIINLNEIIIIIIYVKCLQDFREISSKLIFESYHTISDHE